MGNDVEITSMSVEDIKAKVMSVLECAEQQKVFHIYNQELFLNSTKHIDTPAIGIVYEGIAKKGWGTQEGLTSILAVSVVLLVGDKDLEVLGQEDKNLFIDMLGKFRHAIMGTYSPTGHKWGFVAERPLDISDRALCYYQRWETSIILT